MTNKQTPLLVGTQEMAQIHPAGLVLTDFSIKKANILNREPVIEISLGVISKSNDRIYSLHSGNCEIRFRDSLLVNTSLIPDLSSWVGGQAERFEVPSLVMTSNICQNPHTTIPSKPSIKFMGLPTLSSEALRIISEEFERYPATSDKLPLFVVVKISTLLFVEENSQIRSEGGTLVKFEFSYEYPRRDWLEWIGSSGYQTTLMYLPHDVHRRIKELSQNFGYTKDWEVVSMALRNLKASKININVQRGHRSDRTLENLIRNLIANSRKYIYIAVQTIDGTFSDEIAKAVARNVEVKIILGSSRAPDWNKARDPIITALKDLSKYTEIKIKQDWHGRMIIVDNILIIGSLDLDRQGVTVHDNVVVKTDDEAAVGSAKELFFEIAGQSTTLTVPPQ